uniref:Uncharacterized protein n=1 Tax=Oryza rufipogon TaxID=4529 RepID=A0A0E0P584_ORYRU
MATLPPSSSSSISAPRLTPAFTFPHPWRRMPQAGCCCRWPGTARGDGGSASAVGIRGQSRFVTDCDYSGCEISGDEDSNRRLLLHWSSKHDESNNDCDTNAGHF